MNQKKNGLLMRVMAAFGLVLTTVPSIASMSMAGSFRADESGAANYSIPITIPPGVSGVQPSLALSYNSQAGNGDLGIGWALTGVSEITRCARTPTQDAVTYPGSIGFDIDDRFCLDGQRLIRKSGVYGESGSEYRTERDTFSKIVSYGLAGTGPQYFKVWTKAGEIIEYGNTADSKIEAQGITTVRAWVVNKLTDNANNYLTVSYVEDTTNSSYVVDEIKYAGNSVTAQLPNASVKFVYETRTDPLVRYMGGKIIKQTKRLAAVQTYVATTKIREYTLTYGLSPTTQRSRITEIQECAGGTCLPKTVFTWQTQSAKTAFDSVTIASPSNDWAHRLRSWVMDANGDGIVDFVSGAHIDENGAGNMFHIIHSDRPNNHWTLVLPWGDKTVLGDFNGDGITDIASAITTSAYMRLVTPDGSGFLGQIWNVLNQWGSVDMTRAGDFNGDGLSDIASITGTHVYMKLSTGTGFDSYDWTTTNQWGSAKKTFVGDFNGDGLSDIASASSGNIYVRLSTGTGFATTQNWSGSNLWGSDTATWAADFNGDGLMDIASKSGGNVYMKLSTGKSFVYETWPVTNTWGSDVRTFVGDFNGDGLTDIASASGANIYMKFSTGTGFRPETWTADNTWGTDEFTKADDFNGDGLTDIVSGVYVSANGGNVGYYKFNPPGLDLITKFDNGLGSVTDITYEPLTKESDTHSLNTYRMDPRTSNPVIEVVGPLYVVVDVEASDGVGGKLKTWHRYQGLKADRGLNSRGSKGFRRIIVVQLDTGTQTQTEYNQTWPYTGLPKQVSMNAHVGDTSPKISQVDYTYVCKYVLSGTNCATQPGPGSLYFVYESQSIKQSWDLNGAVLPTVTTTSAYDMCGNTTSATTTTGDGYSKTLTNTYSGVDLSNCYLGRLSSSSVTTTAP